jgi:hypothetical protein
VVGILIKTIAGLTGATGDAAFEVLVSIGSVCVSGADGLGVYEGGVEEGAVEVDVEVEVRWRRAGEEVP